MTGYGDIARALTATLKSLVPEATIYSIARVEALKRPAFFFSIKPVITEASNMRTRHNVLSVIIDFFQREKDEAEMYDVATLVRDALGFSYRVGKSYIDVTDYTFDFVGTERNVLEMSITLDYFDEIDADEKADLMEDVDVRIQLEDPVGKEIIS